ncbi:MAG: hypothetical protein WAV48_00675 [Candidatus Magasanikiibacteriota bacterium]
MLRPSFEVGIIMVKILLLNYKEVWMNLLKLFSKEEIDELLRDANPKLEFGDTVMGVINSFNNKKITLGRRYFEGMSLEYFKDYGIFGPNQIFSNEVPFVTLNLDGKASKLKSDGLFHKVDAVLAVSVGIYKFLREDLIVDNKLTRISDGVWEGKIKVNRDVYKLLALNGDTIPGHQFTFFFVDKNRQIVY